MPSEETIIRNWHKENCIALSYWNVWLHLNSVNWTVWNRKFSLFTLQDQKQPSHVTQLPISFHSQQSHSHGFHGKIFSRITNSFFLHSCHILKKFITQKHRIRLVASLNISSYKHRSSNIGIPHFLFTFPRQPSLPQVSKNRSGINNAVPEMSRAHANQRLTCIRGFWQYFVTKTSTFSAENVKSWHFWFTSDGNKKSFELALTS